MCDERETDTDRQTHNEYQDLKALAHPATAQRGVRVLAANSYSRASLRFCHGISRQVGDGGVGGKPSRRCLKVSLKPGRLITMTFHLLG